MTENNSPQSVTILKKLLNSTDVKETHISYAILTDEFVYKIKKPIDLGFLDYSQLKDRKKFCILENELNSRFSKDIYLETLKLCKVTADRFSIEPLHSSLIAIEYIVKMKRIKNTDFLQSRIVNKEITSEEMINVGIEVANIFSSLDNATTIEEGVNAYDTVKYNVVENFQQTSEFIGEFIDKESYEFLQDSSLYFLEKYKTLFNSRFEDGFVKNGHGDLRLDHIYFNNTGQVGLIDCIEFNKRFRYNDIISEAAFLSMGLDFAGFGAYGDNFLKGFLSVLNDENSLLLLNFYRCYLAYVRVKVTLFLLKEKGKDWSEFNKTLEEVKALLRQSVFYMLNAVSPTTLLFYGLMGAGKTANAQRFATSLSFNYISSDMVRKELAKIEITEKAYLDYNTGIYSKEFSYSVYEKIADIVIDNLKLGRASIIDASFTDERYHQIILERVKTAYYKIECTAPEQIILARLQSRLNRDSISDGRPAIYYNQKKTAKFPKADLTVVTDKSFSENMRKIYSGLMNNARKSF